jgi:SPP1 family predicted phage head-tail adaptor
MRSTLAQLMPDTCNLLTATNVSDGAGGNTQTWGTASSGVACRLDPERAIEQLAAGAVQPFTRYVLTLPYNTTITSAYRVEHGGITYNVIGVDADKSWQATRRAKLEKA